MGDLTFGDLKAEVKAGLAGRLDLDLRLGRFVNMAQMRLARMHDFDEMEVLSLTTITNTNQELDRFLQMPTLREVYSVVLLDGANSRKLEGRTPQYNDRMIPKPDYWTRDRPAEYTVWGNFLEFWPLPNATYSIRVRWTQWPPTLVNDTDKSLFLAKDDVIIELAVSRAFYSLGKEEDAMKHEGIARILLEEGKEVDRTRPDIEIKPAISDSQAIVGPNSTPWNDPFVKSTN